jgi:2-dehydro-3-deoxy-D-gluconate 5-dehydrogenase
MRESIQNLFPLAGKVVIVTGGNGGIGKGMAYGLAYAGASIAIGTRTKQRQMKLLPRSPGILA